VAVLLITVPWAVWAVVRLAGLERGYLPVAAIALTPWAAAASWLPVLLALVLRRWRLAAVPLVPALVLTGLVAPRALGGPQDPLPGGRALTVMGANLRVGAADPRALVALARRERVDLLAVPELTPDALPRLRAAGLLRLFPYRIVDARWGSRGNAIVSRYPLRDARRSGPPGPAMPEAVVEVPGARPVHVKAVHPVAPGVGGNWRWERDLRGLPRATPGGELRVLLGDFNATLDHRELRRITDSGYEDAAAVAGDGLRPTYSSLIQIDHVLVDRRARVTATGFHDLRGSDHDALTATVSLPRG
jgi:endonuclease/exonuclease/phosphatase family metal-dependent hydrolase